MKVNPELVLVLPDHQKEEHDREKLVFKDEPENFMGTVVQVGSNLTNSKKVNYKVGDKVHYRPHDGMKVFLKPSSDKYHLVFDPSSILITE